MNPFTKMDYRAFEMFERQWALVTAGSPEHFNGCTIGWGCLGTLWNRPVVTVYLYPSRHTRSFLMDNDRFTVCFFPEDCRKALEIMGSRSGRTGDKVSEAGLTPVAVGGSVGYREASLTFVCRKLYQHPLAKEDLAPDIQEYYQAHPAVYPPDEEGEWQTHWVFVGEILETDA